MNCEEVKILILLQDSGELPESRKQVLESHMATCATCREQQKELGQLRKAMQSTYAGMPRPSDATLQAIQSAAEQQTTHVRWVVWPAWKVAMAAAAGLLLCLTGLQVMTPAPVFRGRTLGTGPIVATEIVPLASFVMGDETNLESYSGDSAMGMLADQLLILQGMKVDSREDLMDDVISPEDNLPTTLQWNNSSEARPETRV